MQYEVLLVEEVEKFILSLPIKIQAKIQRTLDLLREFGYKLSLPHSKTLIEGKKLKELRIKFGTDICRLFYFHYKDKTYVVVSGYMKKEQKTNIREIDKALLLMKQIEEENNA